MPSLSSSASWHHEPPSNSVRAARVRLSPPVPVKLFGFGARTEQSSHTLVPLEANVLGFGDGQSAIYLVTVDALYGGGIRASFARLAGVPEHQVVVAGSHTHFAPGVDAGLPRLGQSPEGFVDEIAEGLWRGLNATSTVQAAKASYDVDAGPGMFVNRRYPTLGIGVRVPKLGRVVRTPNLAGSVDESVRTATLTSEDKLVAVIWGVGCHPVCSPDPQAISACFPGRVRDAIRHHVGDPDLPVLFLQGFSGDVRPASISRRPPRRAAGLAQYILGGARVFVPQTTAKYEAWTAAVSAGALRALRKAEDGPVRPISASVHRSRVQFEGWARPIEGSLLKLTSGLSLMGVNAEVMSCRTSDLAMLGGQVFPVGCVDEVIGYWPTDKMLAEGGYEGCTSRAWFPPVDWGSTPGPDAVWRDLLTSIRPARWD